MTIFGFVNQLANLYEGAKSTISDIYDGVSKVSSFARQGADWVDEQLNKASSVPFIGEALQAGVDKARNAPVFCGASLEDIRHGLDVADNFIQSNTLKSVGHALDQGISGGLQALQTVSAG